MKKLYRSRTDRKLTGFAAGLGQFFNIDPTMIRLGLVCFVLLTGVFPGVVLYFIASIITPEEE